MAKIFLQSFGCRASQADGAALEAAFAEKGYQRAGGAGSADLIVLNTCTVTATADADLRQVVRRVHHENPTAQLVLTGCYAQRAPEELAALPGVLLVVGNSDKTRLPELLEDVAPYHGRVVVGDLGGQSVFLSAPVQGAGPERTRPNLKVQDGCNNRCSFCIIPGVRGRSRSMPLQQVLQEVRQLAERYREIVLTGINLGRWGREPGVRSRLVDLVRTLLSETDVARLRISSVEPMDLSDELLELMASSERIAAHIHAPLQSGSDAVLRRMRRRYRARHYADRVRRGRELMPDAAIGADVMAGFPGETEEEFAETVRLIQEMPFTYLHVFTYSERPGTPAAEEVQVPGGERKRRTRILQALSQEKNAAFRARMVGKTLPAVTLEERCAALTSNFLKVQLAQVHPPNELVEVRIGAVSATGLCEAGVLPVLR